LRDTTVNTATRVKDCLQTKFYGVYQLLRFKVLKTYGYRLEEVIAGEPQKAIDMIRELVDKGEIPAIVARECLETRACSESQQVHPAVVHVYPQYFHSIADDITSALEAFSSLKG
jgi:hypothetical protein